MGPRFNAVVALIWTGLAILNIHQHKFIVAAVDMVIVVLNVLVMVIHERGLRRRAEIRRRADEDLKSDDPTENL